MRLHGAMLRRIGLLALLSFVLPQFARGEPVCDAHSFEGSRFTVCTFDSRTEKLRLVWKNAQGQAIRTIPRLKKALGPDAARLRFMMNAGMYESDGSPVGLYVENGATLNPLNTRDADGNFYLKPNGVFSLDGDGTVRVETTEAFAARGGAPVFATQSGPMLLIGGKLHPQISQDGPSRLIRNGVGIRDAHTALFVISDDPVSFGRMARFFRDALGCADALFLDGTISTLWVPRDRRVTGGKDIGPMILVFDKP
jgi:uncharacterized protein YigE (DUF2233 family)